MPVAESVCCPFEPDGESTARRIVAYSLLLIPISLVPRLLGMTGSIYAAAAVVAGLVMEPGESYRLKVEILGIITIPVDHKP